jgi:predicted RNA binding protein YcfA (HicA-like mRNA interferase family)
MKVSELLRLLRDDGWFLVATRGSHRQFKHTTKPGRVTVPGSLAMIWHQEHSTVSSSSLA